MFAGRTLEVVCALQGNQDERVVQDTLHELTHENASLNDEEVVAAKLTRSVQESSHSRANVTTYTMNSGCSKRGQRRPVALSPCDSREVQ